MTATSHATAAVVGLDGGHAPALKVKAGHAHALDDAHAEV